MSFSGKVVIITGASSGIGASTAILFAREGANVAIVGRNETRLKAVEEKIRELGKDLLVIKADVSVDSEAKRIIDETIKKYGKLDVLVNNAGLAKYGTIQEGTILEAFDGLINVNVRAVINLTSLASPHLIKSKGNIVNISSVAALTVKGYPMFNAYSVSKAALDHFTKAAAAELGPLGVRVNSVNPGPVETDFLKNTQAPEDWSWELIKEMNVLKKVSAPEEIADMIAFIAGEKGRSMTGSIVVVDNGYVL